MKLFVSGLAWKTSSDGLRAAFESFGEIKDAAIVLEKESGRSRGFGFVTFSSDADAQAALQAMDGANLDGRFICVKIATEKPRREFNHNANMNPNAVAHPISPESIKRNASRAYKFADKMDDADARDRRKKDKRKRNAFDDDEIW